VIGGKPLTKLDVDQLRYPNLQPLQDWLFEKPFDWGPALALRTAIRALPGAMSPACSPEWLQQHALPIFHGLFVGWSTQTRPIKGNKFAAELSVNLLYPAALSSVGESYYASAIRALSTAISCDKKDDKATASYRSIVASFELNEKKLKNSNFYFDLMPGLQDDIDQLLQYPVSRNDQARQILLSDITKSGDGMRAWGNNMVASMANLKKSRVKLFRMGKLDFSRNYRRLFKFLFKKIWGRRY
jgi:hypothetical protein